MARPDEAARVAAPHELPPVVAPDDAALTQATSRVRAVSKARPAATGTSDAILPRPLPRAAFAGGGKWQWQPSYSTSVSPVTRS